MRPLSLVLPLVFAVQISAQTVTNRFTTCQTAVVPVNATRNARVLLGCGEQFPDNVLWALDRSDSVDGTLDGKARMKETGRGAVVYFLDLGIRRAHVEFTRTAGTNVIGGIHVPNTVWPGMCEEPVLNPCSIDGGHGTWVSSLAGGINTGVAPDAQLVAVYTNLEYRTMGEALKRVAAHAFDPATPPFQTAIINISGGSLASSAGHAELVELYKRMVNGVDANGEADPNGKKFLITAASGNAALSPDRPTMTQCDAAGNLHIFPAALGASTDGIIAVGAITRENRMWDRTCKGPGLEVLAPGADMFMASTEGNDLYVLDPTLILSGTSFAAPYVAGMAARLLEHDPSLTPAQLEALLKASPSKVDGLPVPVSTFEPTSRRRAVRY